MESWDNPGAVGVLIRVPDTALVTFGDLSTLLASSERGARDQTFAIRKVSRPANDAFKHPSM